MARPKRNGSHPATRPLPTANQARAMRRGWGAAAVVRFLRGQGCSLDELTQGLGLTPSRVRQILNTPCTGRRA